MGVQTLTGTVSFLNDRLWSIMSKAALKSNSTAPTILLSIYLSFVPVQYMLGALLYKHAVSLFTEK